MKKKTLKLVVLIPLSVWLSGCSGSMAKRLGTNIGQATGAVVATKIGGKTGKAIGAATSYAGHELGKKVGKELDKRDQLKMEAAAQRAIAAGGVQTWSNPENGTSGAATVVQSATNGSGETCGQVKQTVKLKSGETREHLVDTCDG